MNRSQYIKNIKCTELIQNVLYIDSENDNSIKNIIVKRVLWLYVSVAKPTKQIIVGYLELCERHKTTNTLNF